MASSRLSSRCCVAKTPIIYCRSSSTCTQHPAPDYVRLIERLVGPTGSIRLFAYATFAHEDVLRGMVAAPRKVPEGCLTGVDC